MKCAKKVVGTSDTSNRYSIKSIVPSPSISNRSQNRSVLNNDRNWNYFLFSLLSIVAMPPLSDCAGIEDIFGNSLVRQNLSRICCYSIILFFLFYRVIHPVIVVMRYGEVFYWFKFINTTSHWFILCLFNGFCDRIACTQFSESWYIMQLKIFYTYYPGPKVEYSLFSRSNRENISFLLIHRELFLLVVCSWWMLGI